MYVVLYVTMQVNVDFDMYHDTYVRTCVYSASRYTVCVDQKLCALQCLYCGDVERTSSKQTVLWHVATLGVLVSPQTVFAFGRVFVWVVIA